MRTSPAARCASRQHEQVQGQCRQNTLNLGSKCMFCGCRPAHLTSEDSLHQVPSTKKHCKGPATRLAEKA